MQLGDSLVGVHQRLGHAAGGHGGPAAQQGRTDGGTGEADLHDAQAGRVGNALGSAGAGRYNGTRRDGAGVGGSLIGR